ncbi:peptidoglycan recognition family protein [Streptomyces sp. NPDC046977]|uniref:N-acetylmuramoyl-L-alanine amidase n=1 Tax=Streptomyces sp. NPDC046977 TaxID=3154703 RepID=UPI0033D56AAD
MARMPGATWRPVPNCTKGGQEAVYGAVLHIMAGTLDGSDSWFRNPKSEASAHFGVGKDGRIYQWVDTADRAWAQSSGNRTWLSIEHEGQGGDALTAPQLAATARIIAWMHATHGVKLQIADSPTGRGIGWHGMGGSDWGGHYDCPGTPIKNQRSAIIAAASGTPQEDDVTPEDIAKIAAATATKLIAGGGVLETSDLDRIAAKVKPLVATQPVALTDAQVAALAASPVLAEGIAERLAQKLADRLAK